MQNYSKVSYTILQKAHSLNMHIKSKFQIKSKITFTKAKIYV